LIFWFREDLGVQGRSDVQRDLLDVESVAGHLLKPGSVFTFLAAHRRELFADELFADLFPSGRGRPSVPVDVMAAVITLQALQGLSDAETVDAVTFDLRWKAACGLPVTAAAFHATTLTYWRRRLAASDRPNRIFDAVRSVVAQTGVLAGKTRRALDSTILDDAVATQDTVTQLIAAIRRVRREVPGAAVVVAEHCTAHDYDDAGKPAIAWNDEQARAGLLDALVGDAHRLLGHLPEQELGPKAADAVALLALVAGQDVEPVEGSDGTDGRWRIAQRVAPDRIISTVDAETRHAHKTVHRRQDGFKAHVAVEPDTGIITDCMLTKASGPDCSDAAIGPTLLAEEPAPVQVLADSAYGSGDARAELAEAGHDAVIKPIPLRTAVPGGFTLDDFTLDDAAETVTCPAGHTKQITKSRSFGFGVLCRSCPLRARCTTSKTGRSLTLHEHETLLRAARRQAETVKFQTIYPQHRPMVERSIAWLVRGNRRVRYRGVTNNDHWLHHRAAALNLRRMITLGLDHNGTTWALT
jgi:IS5 family transposase